MINRFKVDFFYVIYDIFTVFFTIFTIFTIFDMFDSFRLSNLFYEKRSQFGEKCAVSIESLESSSPRRYTSKANESWSSAVPNKEFVDARE